ncbi:hypothetical protein [Catellatospora vulcania]|uniref:hypothetical protein n=1 Tax=Catellatospora vulcania TaxID=1460450 RepID=UPI0038B2EED6
MTAGTRSRRAGGISPEEARHRPLYARVLGLQYVRPSNLMCFLFFEGTVALAVLLSLAELTGWWAVAVLPASVAVMVKLNDVIAGATTRSGGTSARSRGTATRPKSATRRAPAQPTVRLRVAAPAETAPPPETVPPQRPAGDERDPYANRPGYSEPEGFAARSGNGGQDSYTGRTGYGEQEMYAGQAAYGEQETYAGQSAYGYAQDGYDEQETYAGQSGNSRHGAPGHAASAEPDGEEPWLGTAEQRARQSAAYRYE